MKMQQQQKELNMKPWEREIQEMERQCKKSYEEQNIHMNQHRDTGFPNQSPQQFFQDVKVKKKDEIMA